MLQGYFRFTPLYLPNSTSGKTSHIQSPVQLAHGRLPHRPLKAGGGNRYLFLVLVIVGILLGSPVFARADVQLAATPSYLSFRDVKLGSSSTQSITLYSGGTTPLTISSIAVSGEAFSFSSRVSFPVTLLPGKKLSVSVRFRPLTPGDASGAITFSSTGGTSSVNLQGRGTVSQLTVAPGMLNFGNVNLNSTATQNLVLTSSGTAPVIVRSVSLSGVGFAISANAYPLTLNPGQSVSVRASFTPASVGAATGSIAVTSNSATASKIKVALSGSGKSSQIAVSPAVLSFGDVPVNTAATKFMTLTASGTAPVTVNSAGITGSGFTLTGATFPATLNPGQTLSLQVNFDPKVTGTAAGSVTVSSNASSGSLATVALSGAGTAPRLTVSATSLSFGNVVLNTSSSQTLNLASTGTAPLTIRSAILAGNGFSLSGATFPVTINPGQTLGLQVVFNPAMAGAVTGSITISSDSLNGNTTTVALTATGTVPQLRLSAASLSFGNVALNATASQTLTLTSSGTAPVTIHSAALTGTAFTVSGASFPAVLNPGQSLSLQVSFNPTTAGAATANLTISSNSSAGSTATVALSGTGASPQLTVSSSTIDFGSVVLNSASNQTLTLTSSGTAPVTVNSATIAGAGFTLAGATLPATLNPGQTLSLQVTFSPTVSGAASGSLTISSNSSRASTVTVALSGTGTSRQLSVSVSTLAFGNVALGSNSIKTVTLTSSGTAAVTVNSAGLSGTGFTLAAATFPATLNPGQSLTLQVTFSPTVAGSATGSLTISSNSSTGSTSTVAITGTGTSSQLAVSPATLAFGNVNLNSTSTQSVTLTASGTAATTVNSAAVTGTGFTLSGTTFPITMNPGQTLTLQVGFSPTVAGAATGAIVVSSNASSGSTSTVSLNGTGAAGLMITTTTLPAAVVGTPYQASLQVTGGTAPYTWTLASGSFPAAISLATNGSIAGTPTTAGSSTFTVRVTDSTSATNTATFAITVNGSLSITTTSVATGIVGTAYTQALAASGGTPAYTWSLASGTLPSGLSLTSAGIISGTPTTAGAYSFTVQVRDSASATKTATFAATVTTSTSPQYTMGDTLYPYSTQAAISKGQSYTDATYHVPVTRITNATADLGLWGMTTNYSTWNPLSSDGNYLILMGCDNNVYDCSHLVVYDANTHNVVRDIAPIIGSWNNGDPEPRWDRSGSHPTWIYYNVGMQLRYLDVSDGSTHLKHDFSANFSEGSGQYIQNGQEGSPSEDTRYWAFAVWLNTITPRRIFVYDSVNDTVVSQMSAVGLSVNNVMMSPDGNYVYVATDWTGSGGNFDGPHVWKRDFSSCVKISGGIPHANWAWSKQGNLGIVRMSTLNTPDEVSFVRADNGAEYSLYYQGNLGWSDSNLLHAYVGATKKGWGFISTYSSNNSSWDYNQIWAFEIDETKCAAEGWWTGTGVHSTCTAAPRIWRVAFTQNIIDASYYFEQPNATMDYSGKHIWFTSNWRTPSGKEDVYQVDLPATWLEDLAALP